jgi:ribosomal protein S18 acetylase RimI-like enzyme
MQIRPFERDDERAVVALWNECRLTRPWNDPHKAGYEGHRGWVNYLAVAPAFRGRGFARALMEHVEKALVARGCPKLSLLVRNSNRAAIDFYRHLGYGEDESVSLGKRLIADA